jgi:hypothetical protein
MVGEDFSFSLIDDERPLTEHVHLAFPAQDDATVRAFHAAALAAGYEDHGGPGERAVYHLGYYGAFVLDPDGHNVRSSTTTAEPWLATPPATSRGPNVRESLSLCVLSLSVIGHARVNIFGAPAAADPWALEQRRTAPWAAVVVLTDHKTDYTSLRPHRRGSERAQRSHGVLDSNQ